MAPWESAARALATDLQSVFGPRLLSVVAYGPQLDGHASAPLTALALVSSLGVGDLDACGRLEAEWRRSGVATPLILPRHEFESSLDVFPLEYGEIIRAHAHVFGPDPFVGIDISVADLRHACEAQIKSHLVHLREGYIEAAGRLEAVADLVKEAAPPFAALLRNVARLHGVESHDRMEATRQGARAAGLTDDVVNAVLALEYPSGPRTTDPARLFPDYLAAVEQLARAVDSWRT
jgi:hypothetical protein